MHSFARRARAVAALGLATAVAGLVGTAQAAPKPLACGDVITKDTTLMKTLGPCPGNGLIVGADNITVNLNGYAILGQSRRTGDFAGVRVPMKTGVTIIGGMLDPLGKPRGTISGFDAGVLINGGSANTVKNLVVKDNLGAPSRDSFLGDGIAVLNSANNTIQRNVVDHNGIYDGIGVLGKDAHANTVRDNTVSHGVALIMPPDDFTGAGNGTGVGIVVDAYLDPLPPGAPGPLIHGNQVLNNIVTANDGSGISNVMTQDGRVAGNTIEDNGHVQIPGNGIGLQLGLFPQSTEGRMVVENNVIRRNGGTGIFSTEDMNTVRGNTVEDNGFNPARSWDPWGGIYMQVTPLAGGGVVEDNTVRHNGGYGFGIDFESIDRANGGVTGPSSNNRIQNNHVSDHSWIGIFLWVTGGTNNSVLSNYAVNSDAFDLIDVGAYFGFYPGCGGNVWFDNTYETAEPPCVTDGGHQVSVDGATPPSDSDPRTHPPADAGPDTPPVRHRPNG